MGLFCSRSLSSEEFFCALFVFPILSKPPSTELSNIALEKILRNGYKKLPLILRCFMQPGPGKYVTRIDKRNKMLSTHLQFTKGRQKSGSISLDLSVLFTQTKLHSEPVQLQGTMENRINKHNAGANRRPF